MGLGGDARGELAFDPATTDWLITIENRVRVNPRSNLRFLQIPTLRFLPPERETGQDKWRKGQGAV